MNNILHRYGVNTEILHGLFSIQNYQRNFKQLPSNYAYVRCLYDIMLPDSPVNEGLFNWNTDGTIVYFTEIKNLTGKVLRRTNNVGGRLTPDEAEEKKQIDDRVFGLIQMLEGTPRDSFEKEKWVRNKQIHYEISKKLERYGFEIIKEDRVKLPGPGKPFAYGIRSPLFKLNNPFLLRFMREMPMAEKRNAHLPSCNKDGCTLLCAKKIAKTRGMRGKQKQEVYYQYCSKHITSDATIFNENEVVNEEFIKNAKDLIAMQAKAGEKYKKHTVEVENVSTVLCVFFY